MSAIGPIRVTSPQGARRACAVLDEPVARTIRGGHPTHFPLRFPRTQPHHLGQSRSFRTTFEAPEPPPDWLDVVPFVAPSLVLDGDAFHEVSTFAAQCLVRPGCPHCCSRRRVAYLYWPESCCSWVFVIAQVRSSWRVDFAATRCVPCLARYHDRPDPRVPSNDLSICANTPLHCTVTQEVLATEMWCARWAMTVSCLGAWRPIAEAGQRA